MSQDKIEEIKTKIKQNLNAPRYEHTIGVMNTAQALAKRYQVDEKKAILAGLLHDCAKRIAPGVEHAKMGAELAKKEYGITDSDILDAITCHTTGRPNMSMLDKILYIADYIEPGRKEAPRLEEMRQLAFEDLEECLYLILEDTLSYLQTRDIEIDPMTEETYLYYKKQLNK